MLYLWELACRRSRVQPSPVRPVFALCGAWRLHKLALYLCR